MSSLRVAVYHNLHSGGAKRVVSEQLCRLVERHEVALFSLSSADHAFADEPHPQHGHVPVSILDYRSLPMAPSPFGRLNPLVGLLNVAKLDRLARQTASLIDRQRFDVVLVHPCQVTQAPRLLTWLRTPAVYFCQELPRRLYEPPVPRPMSVRARMRTKLDTIDPLRSANASVLRTLDRRAARRAKVIATNSHHTADAIRSAYGRAGDVCYLGVDASRFGPGVPAIREGFVLSVGAVTPAKGFDFLIRAIATLPEAHRPRLVLVGNYQEPEEMRFLSALARASGVSLDCRVGVGDEELASLYARAGCVAYAPIREPFGLVALEAMSAGAALVAVREGGVAETVVHNVSGILAEREPTIFGRALREVLRDPERAAALGNRARQYVLERWTWERHVEQLEVLLQQAAQHRIPNNVRQIA